MTDITELLERLDAEASRTVCREGCRQMGCRTAVLAADAARAIRQLQEVNDD